MHNRGMGRLPVGRGRPPPAPAPDCATHRFRLAPFVSLRFLLERVAHSRAAHRFEEGVGGEPGELAIEKACVEK
jgi:hypothetical protein